MTRRARRTDTTTQRLYIGQETVLDYGVTRFEATITEIETND